ncbi:MAG: GNAT family N-acetyltransferase [Helicobacteraceae bacterium]|nr:GNAT family N-acetyltransferase [Helicobacteraceae bacterium]
MIRAAKKTDSKKAIALLGDAAGHFIYKMSGYDDKDKALAVLEEFFCKENNRLSYQNVFVYEQNNIVIGAICIYDGAKAESLDELLNLHLHKLGKENLLKECEDEYYLDTIAVDIEARGQGIAKKLIEFATKEAQNKGKKLSLIVEYDNTIAKALYHKLGFKFVKIKDFHGHKYEYMIRK